MRANSELGRNKALNLRILNVNMNGQLAARQLLILNRKFYHQLDSFCWLESTGRQETSEGQMKAG